MLPAPKRCTKMTITIQITVCFKLRKEIKKKDAEAKTEKNQTKIKKITTVEPKLQKLVFEHCLCRSCPNV